ncbi:nuclear transport factor 2 family protein [Bosea sp. BK604]|uniref:nuclear transport factor 2 family protein n=1 Tax=Bosea sp. BK604 TaxID=2512180 RepID=UPI0010F39BF3|nr:nuclear transport factor 2 family protein [Bosea sp. BK604]TCR63993.1 SnoaL-like protein [Bosea sp. BK604]
MKQASLQDWFEINSLFIRYATSLDHCDVEAVVGCFSENAFIESPVLGRFEGHAGIRDFAERTERVTRERKAQFRHVVSNVTAEVEGDKAKARCYLLDFYTCEGVTELLSPGEYVCDLTRVDGRWLFDSRVVIMDKSFDVHM